MKKILSAALSISMLASLLAFSASADTPALVSAEDIAVMSVEQIAYLDVETAAPAVQDAILEARAEIIYGDQAWTVNGAVSIIDSDGSTEKLPEFSELFPGWDIPQVGTLPTDDGSVLQNVRDPLSLFGGSHPNLTRPGKPGAFDRGVNVLFHSIHDPLAGEEFAAILGNGNGFAVFEQTNPSDSETHNLAVSDRSQGLVVGWVTGLRKGQGAQVSTRDETVYSFRGNVFEEADEGWRHVRIMDTGAPAAEAVEAEYEITARQALARVILWAYRQMVR